MQSTDAGALNSTPMWELSLRAAALTVERPHLAPSAPAKPGWRRGLPSQDSRREWVGGGVPGWGEGGLWADRPGRWTGLGLAHKAESKASIGPHCLLDLYLPASLTIPALLRIALYISEASV